MFRVSREAMCGRESDLSFGRIAVKSRLKDVKIRARRQVRRLLQ